MEPLSKKKFLVLLDQEEERHYGFDLLKNIHDNISILYTTEWDCEIKQYHEESFPGVEKYYLDDIALNQNVLQHDNILEVIENVLKSGPIPLTIRELANHSQEFLRPYHNRFYNITPNYELFIKEIAAFHQFLFILHKTNKYALILAPFKTGWQRKYSIYYFMSLGIPVTHLTDLRRSSMFVIEEWICGEVRFIGKSSKELFISSIIDSGKDKVGINDYRDIENKNHNRTGHDWLKKKILNIVLNKFRVIFGRIPFMLSGRIKIKTVSEHNRYVYSLLHNFTYAAWEIATLINIICDLAFVAMFSGRIKSLLNKPYVLVALHYFPESSTVGEYGRIKSEVEYFSEILNAYDHISNIIVIDHPTMVFSGERPRWQKNYFRQHSGVRYFPLIGFNGIDFDLISNADAVITIAGGIALEKALTGKGVAKISVLHPMLCVENIYYFESSKICVLNLKSFNKNIREYTAQQYCIEVDNMGFKISDFSEVFLRYAEKYHNQAYI